MSDAWRDWYEQHGKIQLRAVVWVAWDPLGINDEPSAYYEYDDYLDDITYALREDWSNERLANFLDRVGSETMGMSNDRELSQRAAEALRAWYRAENESRSKGAGPSPVD